MDKFDQIAQLIEELGEYACEAQKSITIGYKKDGTVLTETDTLINREIGSLLLRLFPQANVVTEEELYPLSKEAPITFILDPIDGTDVYSQGLPSWCIALGILDEKRAPVGAMINAPRWGLSRDEGLFLRLDPHKELTLNGKPFSARVENGKMNTICMASHVAKSVDIVNLGAKVRSYGSNIIHMISPLIHPLIQGTASLKCYAWDIAAAHALLINQNLEVQTPNGENFIYSDELLFERKNIPSFLFSGTKETVEQLKKQFS